MAAWPCRKMLAAAACAAWFTQAEQRNASFVVTINDDGHWYLVIDVTKKLGDVQSDVEGTRNQLSWHDVR
jgi:hypothetical protein